MGLSPGFCWCLGSDVFLDDEWDEPRIAQSSLATLQTMNPDLKLLLTFIIIKNLLRNRIVGVASRTNRYGSCRIPNLGIAPMLKWQPIEEFGSITGPVGTAAIYTVVTQYLSSNAAELWSELLCWLLLPILFRSARQSSYSLGDNKGSRDSLPSPILRSPGSGVAAGSLSLWAVAFAIAVVSVYRAEYKSVVVFLPILSPLLLLVQSGFSRSDAPSPDTPPSIRPIVQVFLFDTLRGSFLYGLFAAFTLCGWDLGASVFAAIPAIAMLVIYTSFEHANAAYRTYFYPKVHLQQSVTALAPRVVVLLVACLTLDASILDFTRINIPSTVFLGIAKALAWFFMARTAECTSWRIAPAIGTFGITATLGPFSQASEFQAISHMAVSILALGNMVHLISKPSKTKRVPTLWLLAIASLGPYIINLFVARDAVSTAQTFAGHSEKHPVEILSRKADIKFQHLLKTQSANYTAAHVEYVRRYGTEPPPGLEEWFDFAIANQSPIIDDFDMIFDSVSPLLKMSGEQVNQVMRTAYEATGSDLWLCSFSSARGKTQCQHAYRTFDRNIASSFNKLSKGLEHSKIPDLKFLVNHLDEPRVLLPSQFAGDVGGQPSITLGRFSLKNMSGRPVGEEITKHCLNQEQLASRHTRNSTVESYDLPFVSDLSRAADLCQHPEHTSLHGLIARPKSFRLIEGLVPILSTGALSSMGDIVYPSPAYLEEEFQYADDQDIEWEKKSNNVYWTGSNTGGFAVDGSWRNYHRQRFVALAQNLQKPEEQHHTYLRLVNGVVERVTSSFLNSRLYDVAFTRLFQCRRTQCRDQHSYFNVRSWVDKNQAFRSRLVFDLDGNGISGRYYKFLASKSTPLKQTLLREWHDERLVPWTHYVPISLSMKELPELVSYLTTTDSGQQRARNIAMQGREWQSKSLREVDFTIYNYRLLLELARLQDPKRKQL
ncbi:hypothetical protein CSIM01_07889 [Colletotrichum simmondsii]|uniref:Glycosyl transferase CAP10 domain-containing protein n=1 Tax=Colletotrichum simmondsii TaxID=703756 RepID=A0A135TV75_9PEZI|nr:hypothetical protein CSIM01_07889 [Colletotrichum simmondsii]